VTVHCVLKDLGDILGGVCPWGTFVLGQMSGGQQVSGGGRLSGGSNVRPPLASQRQWSVVSPCRKEGFMDVEVRSSSSVNVGPSYAWKKAACREHGVRLWTRGVGLCGEDRERD